MVMIALLVGPVLPVVAVTVSSQTVFAAQHERQQMDPRTWHVTVGVQTSDGAISGMAFLQWDTHQASRPITAGQLAEYI
jgi:hypothetical protein